MKISQHKVVCDQIFNRWMKKQQGQANWLQLPLLLAMSVYSLSAQAESEANPSVKIEGTLAEPGQFIEKVVLLQDGREIVGQQIIEGAGFQLAIAHAGLDAARPVLIKVISQTGVEFTYLLQDVAGMMQSEAMQIEVSYLSTLHQTLISQQLLEASTSPEDFAGLLDSNPQYTDLMAAAKTVVDYNLPEVSSGSVAQIYAHFLAQGQSYLAEFRIQYATEFEASRLALYGNEQPGAGMDEALLAGGGIGVGEVAAGSLGLAAAGGAIAASSAAASTAVIATEAIATATVKAFNYVLKGVISDGYVAGAEVFLDLDGDLKFNEDPNSLENKIGRVQTAEDGSFAFDMKGLTSEERETIDKSGKVVAIGGTDTSTGQAVKQIMISDIANNPGTEDADGNVRGQVVVNPLTTMVSTLVSEQKVTAEAAKKTVAKAFGIDESVDVTKTDLLDASVDDQGQSDAAAVKSQVAAVTLATVVDQLTQMVADSYRNTGAPDGTLTDAQWAGISSLVFKYLSKQMTENSEFSLANAKYDALFDAIVVELNKGAAGNLGIGPVADTGSATTVKATDVDAVVKQTVKVIDEATKDKSGLEALVKVTAVQKLASQAVANELAGEGEANLADLSKADGAVISVTNAEKLEGEVGNFAAKDPVVKSDDLAHLVVKYGDTAQIELADIRGNDTVEANQKVFVNGEEVTGATFNVGLPARFETLAAGQQESFTFSYQVKQYAADLKTLLGTTVKTVTLTVEGTFAPPVNATAGTVSAVEPLALDLLGALSAKLSSGSYEIQIMSRPAHGTLARNDDGTLTYTPDANHFKYLPEYEGDASPTGSDQFSYALRNKATRELSEEITFKVKVQGVNDAPETAPVELPAVQEDAAPITITQEQLLAGASDVDGDTLSLSDVALVDTAAGTLVDNGDGTYTLTLAENFNGAVAIGYKVSDGQAEPVAGTATLPVSAVNDAPVVVPVVLAAGSEGTETVIVTAEQLLSGASDVDSDALSVSEVALVDAAAGTLSDNGDGSYTLTLAENYNGSVEIGYKVSDGTAVVAGNASLTFNPMVSFENLQPLEGGYQVDMVIHATDDRAVGSLGGTLALDGNTQWLEYGEGMAPLAGAGLSLAANYADGHLVIFGAGTLAEDTVLTLRFESTTPVEQFNVGLTEIEVGIERGETQMLVEEPVADLSLPEAVIAQSADTPDIQGTEANDHLFLLDAGPDAGYTVTAGDGDDLITLMAAAMEGNRHTLSGGAGADTYLLAPLGQGGLEVNAVITDFAVSEDRIDLSMLRDADGNVLEASDIALNANTEGYSVLDLSAFTTAGGQAVSGQLQLAGVANGETVQFLFSHGPSLIDSLDTLDSTPA